MIKKKKTQTSHFSDRGSSYSIMRTHFKKSF